MISDIRIKKFWLNAYQPYSHGNWSNKNLEIGNEESLQGRNKFILDEFEKIIKKKYNLDQIKKMRLLDVGSYDGQISCEIEKRLPFKEIISIEPREKNFEKGKYVRDFLKIKTNVKFYNEKVENINEKFDIIFCVGVLHHLSDINIFLKKLCSICEKIIYVEYLSFDSKNKFLNFFLKKLSEKIIEPKDIIYKFEEKTVGISGHKLETNYYDGSTIDYMATVSYPDNNYISQIFYVNGFTNALIKSGNEYNKFINSKNRNFSASIMYAEKDENFNSLDKLQKYIFHYEKSYLINYINLNIIKYLEKYKFLLKLILLFKNKKDFHYELLINLKYNFKDKINFEKSKNYLHKKKIFKATRILFRIISNFNSDYRTCYRSFVLLAFIYRNKASKKKLFLDLLKNINQRYPHKILDELEIFYNL